MSITQQKSLANEELFLSNYKNYGKDIDFRTLLNTENECLLSFFTGVSNNPTLTITDILKNPEKRWSWYCISQHKNITFQNVLDHPELPWDYRGLSMNPNISLEDIQDHLNHPWDFEAFHFKNL